MIINHYYKFIFIHIPKTAGTTLHFFLKDLPESETFWGYQGTFDRAHITVSQLPHYVSRSLIREYKIFCFCRNPYDRLYSAFVHVKEAVGWRKDFHHFVKEIVATEKIHTLVHIKPMTHFVKQSRNSIAFIGKFEDFDNQLDKLLQEFGVQERPTRSENVRSNLQQEGKYLRNYYAETIQMVNRVYADDFQYFGYMMQDPNQFPKYPKHKNNQSAGIVRCKN